MFRCDNCKVVTAPRIPAALVTVETRKVQYDNGFDEEGNPKISFGEEIVREIQCCPGCAEELSK